MNILLTGATGDVGRHVREGRAACGHRVRALSRSPGAAAPPAGVEVVQGGLERPETLAALADIERMYLFPVPETAHEVAAPTRKAGVRHIVVQSSTSVLSDDEAQHSARHHRTVERAVEDSGVARTFARRAADHVDGFGTAG